ncbi:protease PrsW [Thermoplasmatales archaeon SG8-52-1]|nr:MAG: protease PrsW [Thermoplasmatales archaeon SG8-52-1]
MEELPQALLFIGIIPALILLFISLKGYEGYYKEKLIFLTFVVGLIIGVITVVIETYTAEIGIYFIILFPILEQLFKTIVLNIGRFHGKNETPVYGLSLGLGFGSIFIPSSLVLLNIQGVFDNLSIALSIIGSIGIILIHAATGVCIGYGVYQYSLIKYVLFAIILYIPVTALTFISTYVEIVYIQLAIFPYGIILYWYITTRIMIKIKSDSRGRKRSKK